MHYVLTAHGDILNRKVESSKLKILQVNAYYRFDSMGKIVFDISSGLFAHGYQFVLKK